MKRRKSRGGRKRGGGVGEVQTPHSKGRERGMKLKKKISFAEFCNNERGISSKIQGIPAEILPEVVTKRAWGEQWIFFLTPAPKLALFWLSWSGEPHKDSSLEHFPSCAPSVGATFRVLKDPSPFHDAFPSCRPWLNRSIFFAVLFTFGGVALRSKC